MRLVPVPFAIRRAIALAADRLANPPITRSQVALLERDNTASVKVPGLAAQWIGARDFVVATASRAPQAR